jgi:hypothetical protein
MNRRQAMQAIGALAAGRWRSDGIEHKDKPHESREPGAAGYVVTEFEPYGFINSIHSCCLDFTQSHYDHFESLRFGVYYDEGETVQVDINGAGEDARSGSLSQLTPDQAREASLALFMAAEEVDSYE